MVRLSILFLITLHMLLRGSPDTSADEDEDGVAFGRKVIAAS